MTEVLYFLGGVLATVVVISLLIVISASILGKKYDEANRLEIEAIKKRRKDKEALTWDVNQSGANWSHFEDGEPTH